MRNNCLDVIDEYNKYFFTYITQYSTPERQAEQFKVVSVLKNIPTTETINTITEAQTLQKDRLPSDTF